jgi:hypothetical protein
MIRASGIRVLPGVAGICVFAALLAATASADAAVKISDAATQNMSCSGGVCSPTAKSAVLNAGDLESMLASGNLTVLTAGQGVEAKDINIRSSIGWSSGSTLSLDAYKSITISQPVSIAGLAGLSIVTNDGGHSGTFVIGPKGQVTSANLSSGLSINRAAYTLVGNVKTLASEVASNPQGNFAIANNFDASHDGISTSSPVATAFFGTFEGLGNVISNLSVSGPSSSVEVCLDT